MFVATTNSSDAIAGKRSAAGLGFGHLSSFNFWTRASNHLSLKETSSIWGREREKFVASDFGSAKLSMSAE